MEIIFKTNIDAYNVNDFQFTYGNNTRVPVVGEKIHVSDSRESYFRSKKLPTRLEVKDVNWYWNKVEIELHYNKTDLEFCIQGGGKPYG